MRCFFTDMIEHWSVLQCVCCVVWWYGRFSFLWWRVIKSSSMIVCYFSFENWRNLQFRVSTPVRICIVRLHTIWYPWHFVQLFIFPIQTYFQTLSLSSTDTNKHTHTTNMHTRTHTNYKPLTHVHTNMPLTHTHRLCRHQKSNPLWVSLASAALGKKQLDTAEIALAEINEVTKVIIASSGIVGRKDGMTDRSIDR